MNEVWKTVGWYGPTAQNKYSTAQQGCFMLSMMAITRKETNHDQGSTGNVDMLPTTKQPYDVTCDVL